MTTIPMHRALTGPGPIGRVSRLALAAGLLLPLAVPAPARAFGVGFQPRVRPMPVQHWQAAPPPQPWQAHPVQRQQLIYDHPPATVFSRQPVGYTVQDQLRRCNQGRLVGGLMGGGAGYALTKGNDRVWATPLGALLGSQIGCNAVQGNAPVPW